MPLVVLLLSACSSLEPRSTLPTDHLIVVPTRFADDEPRLDFELLYVDDEMRQFVDDLLLEARPHETRLRRLLRGMSKRGLGQLNYRLDLTYTAEETFHKLRGNCLSFTNLFVALAREAGLTVNYQMVEVPPSWSGADDGLVILNNHMNVLVNLRYHPDYLVDFNLRKYQDNYKTQLVSDVYAEAMFYSNLAVEALQETEYGKSFWYLNRALSLYPDISAPWVNLGVLHARLGNQKYAESAFLRALELDRGNKSALTNLSGLYARTGNVEKSAEFAKKVNYYRERNPYYHYNLASNAYEDGRYDDALISLSRSLRLKKVEHQFHYLRYKTLAEMGRKLQAMKSLEQAFEQAIYKETRAYYAQQMKSSSKL